MNPRPLRRPSQAERWWRTPLIPALSDLYELEASLVSRASARTGSKATQRNPVSNKKQKKTTKSYPEIDLPFLSSENS
ncbi:hypothetical protein I79_014930 [Cricetulus griseus]|uniref:Uncharacterized protein n=1 Tax=Cricetulus griseus TaxID=10029 RepID=G3HVE3_CRIGR|nr:hypothetical protein I79_014930 [Cricetulus griseus]